MTKYLIISGLILVMTSKHSAGQSLPPIQLDRPDQTECPFITPEKYIQNENGFNFEKINANQNSYLYPSSLWKYGINKKFELRLITEIVSQKTSGKTSSGILPITVGFKTSLFEEKGIIPKTSFIGHITTSNIGSKEYHTKFIAPAFRFTMLHNLSETIILAYNIGAEWDGENAGQTYIYTLTTGLGLTEKISFYAELYGYLKNRVRADHRIDGGITYLLNDNFITDISGGIGLTENASEFYISYGISYRFKTSG